MNSSSLYQEIKYYELIDETTFNKLKRENNTGVSVLKLVTASNDWSEFQENLRKYKKETNFEILTNANNQYSSYIHNPIVYTSWEKCVTENCSKLDFTAWVKEEREKEVTVYMKYLYKGAGTNTLRVKVEVNQNGQKETKYITINPGADIPYPIPRVFDNEGKSYMSILFQPVNKRGEPFFDGFKGTSTYFAPTINVKNVSVDFVDITHPIVYSKDNLNAPDYEEKKCVLEICDKLPIGYYSCDKKYLAYPLEATIVADAGCYFETPNDLNEITFDAISGAGAGWNQGALRGDCKSKCAVITYSSPTLIKVRFMGSASKATNWSLYRTEVKPVPMSHPVLYQYADKNTLNLSVPLSYLKENFKINIVSFDAGTFIIDKDSKAASWHDDEAKGLRYYTLYLQRLINPNAPKDIMLQLQ
jgi:hypothetical protein